MKTFPQRHNIELAKFKKSTLNFRIHRQSEKQPLTTGNRDDMDISFTIAHVNK